MNKQLHSWGGKKYVSIILKQMLHTVDPLL